MLIIGSFTIATEYYNNETWTSDWGLIKLNTDIGNNCGWTGIAYSNDYSAIVGQRITLSGYPWDNDNSNYQYYQYESSDNILEGYSDVLSYKVDMTNGQSGCPVWDTSGYSIAINSREGRDIDYNYGICINKNLFDLFVSKMN